MPDADLSPPGVARLIADFLEALDLRDVVLVGNDTGGAICQLLITSRPERIGRLVLTPCDAYENFLPTLFMPLKWAAHVPGLLTAAFQPMRVNALRRLPIGYGMLTKEPIERAVMDSYVTPFLSDRGVRRDTRKLLRGVDRRLTLAAAERFGEFDKPVLLAWAPEDRAFKLKFAQRMQREFPDARLERIDDASTFVSEDQPERLAELIGAFAARPAGVAA